MNETGSVSCGVPQAPTDLLKRRLAGQAAELATAAARVRGGHDPQALHDLVRSARDLGAMLGTWAGLLESRPRRRALRSLRRLRRRLGIARGLEAHIALLESAGAERSEAVLNLLEALRRKLRRRTARAARRLRPGRLRPLMGRIEAAAASLGARRDPHALDRARASVLERRACARVAVELALEREDDWLLRRACGAVAKWRHALECVSGAWEAGPDPRPALGRLEALLAAIRDRAALITALERHRANGAGAGLEPVLGQLRVEKHDAFARFREQAASPGALRPAAARIPRFNESPPEAVSPAPGGADERWERMARWLLANGRGPA